MNYIYLNFNDLAENKQEEIKDIARDEVKAETTEEDSDELNMDYDDLVEEEVGSKLLEMSNKGRFVFNI